MDKRRMQLWYPMRVAYGRDERVIRLKQHLDNEGIENFLPMRRDGQIGRDVEQELKVKS